MFSINLHYKIGDLFDDALPRYNEVPEAEDDMRSPVSSVG